MVRCKWKRSLVGWGRLGWSVLQMVNTESVDTSVPTTLVDDYELDYEAAVWAAKLQ